MAQPFDYGDSRSLTRLARGEFDITPKVTLFAAMGDNHFSFDKRETPSYTIVDTAGNATGVSNFQKGRTHSLSSEAGVRTRFATGGIDHQLVVIGSHLDQTNWLGRPLTRGTRPTSTTPTSSRSRARRPQSERRAVGDTPVTLRANVTNLFDKYYWTANSGGFLTNDVARTFWLSLTQPSR